MIPYWGKALKNLAGWVEDPKEAFSASEAVVTPYGIEGVKGALICEKLPKNSWNDPLSVATCIKHYPLIVHGMQPIDEAISTSGGVMQESMNEDLMLYALPNVFCAGEMLDWDAPTGGYLLSASFASGIFAAKGIRKKLASE
jgi:hypothetical protein